MSTKTSVKKIILLLVALLVCSLFVLTACKKNDSYKGITQPTNDDQAEGFGGIVMQYGEWLYYVNGWQSDASVDNTYESALRTGSIVRVKAEDFQTKIFAIVNQGQVGADKTADIQKAVSGYKDDAGNYKAGYVEVVVPCFYYSGNTTTPELNGFYIYNNRIYVTTPNAELDSKGNKLNNQLCLASYNMGGGDMKVHYVFPSNAPQLKMAKINGEIWAAYILDGKLYSLNVASGNSTEIASSVSSPKFTGDYVYYTNDNGAICQYKLGSGSAKTVVEMVESEGHEGHNHMSYSVISVNGDYVYYTATNSESSSPSENGNVLFYATSEKTYVSGGTRNVVCDALPSGTYLGYKDSVIYAGALNSEETPAGISLYNIWCAQSGASGTTTQEVMTETMGNPITLEKIEGSILYFSANSISYTLDLENVAEGPKSYAKSIGSSTTCAPDVIVINGSIYIFSIADGAVTAVQFDPKTATKTSTTVTMTLVKID